MSIIQHPLGASAPAPTNHSEDRGNHPLGLVPHQIRGYLWNFQNIMIKGRNYDCCSACSDKITGAFKSEGWRFVKKALNEKGFVEDLSGLTEVSGLSVLNITRLTHRRSSDQQRKCCPSCNGAKMKGTKKKVRARWSEDRLHSLNFLVSSCCG